MNEREDELSLQIVIVSSLVFIAIALIAFVIGFNVGIEVVADYMLDQVNNAGGKVRFYYEE